MPKSEPFSELRKRAEGILSRRGPHEKPDLDFLQLVRELEIHHAELEESRGRYLDLYESAPVGFVSLTRKGLVLRANRMAERMLADREGALIGQAFSRRVHPRDYRLYRQALKAAADRRSWQTCEVRIVDQRRKPVWMRIEVNANFDQKENFSEWRLAFLDITEFKLSEEELRHSENKMRSIFRAAPIGIGVVSDRVFLDVNDLMCGMTGYSRDELLGKNSRMIYVSDEDYEYVGREKYRQIGSSGTGTVETRFRCKDGAVIDVLLSSTPINSDDLAAGVLFTALDLTGRKRAERDLQTLNRTLEQQVVERTELAESRARQLRLLVSELTVAEQCERQRLAEMLHDHLQQLLVGAKINSEILSAGIDPKLKRVSENVLKLLKQSLKASRSLTAQLSPPILKQGSLSSMLEWLCRWMQDNHNLKVELWMEPGLDSKREDLVVLLYQSVRELLFNVVKHGRVASARVEMGRDEQKRLRVSVTDRGVGLDPAAVWEKAKAGTGFGLFSIRERLELLGGSLEIESSPGKGASFALIVPLETTSETAAKRIRKIMSKVQRAKAAGDKVRVMIADDHTVVRQGLSTMLNLHSDVEVVGEAADGEEAVEKARNLQPDVILMDISMPGMDGIEATRVIHSEFPDIRIVGLSMFDAEDQAAAMIEAGGSAYRSKSENTDLLLAAIRGD